MRILILSPYYYPESVGAGIWLRQLATDLAGHGHQVTMFTAFPNYPSGKIFAGYRGKLYQREVIDGVKVIRTWIYASTNKGFWRRILNYGSFAASSLISGILEGQRYDVIYTVLPPLPLGVTARFLATVKRARLVLNVQDIFPHLAVVAGVLKNQFVIRFFEAMERWIYHRAEHLVVISDGFRENLVGKGVIRRKVTVVPNWADPEAIKEADKENSFRQELQVDSRFTLIYSGSLSHNSSVESMVDAADVLRGEPFAFVVVGEGALKPKLEQLAAERNLTNLQFRPFQPLERYPEVLAAADMNLVTLSSQAAFASVPSKIFKQMAAGRPVLALTIKGNELDRLVQEARCGLCVPPDDPQALVAALHWAADHPQELARMGRSGRQYLEKYHSREQCIGQIEAILKKVVEV